MIRLPVVETLESDPAMVFECLKKRIRRINQRCPPMGDRGMSAL
jgi:hypothetical protein